MSKKVRNSLILLAMIAVPAAAFVAWASQATATRHAASVSPLGQASSREALVSSLSTGQHVKFRAIKSANWSVPLSGLLNLNHPTAQSAALKDKEEPIQVYAYHIEHPTHGNFLIDTGISQQFVEDPAAQGIPRILRSQLGFDRLEILTSTESVISNMQRPLKGVFMTHLHLDHISGLPAVDKQVPVYVGRGESAERYFLFAATRGIVDTVLRGRPELREWSEPYVDIFGDGSVFAIHSPGHTAGSTAYLINTASGPILIAGDACHTAWGWNNNVEPGKFSTNQPMSRISLNRLVELVKEFPQIAVRPGHQILN
ncbi:MAG: MBL fold metallo-hydrolase [Granulosicoccus sp.]